MPAAAHTEEPFEVNIADHLTAHGWEAIPSTKFDKERAIFPETVIQFIRDTQPKKWEKLERLHGGTTGEVVVSELCKMLDSLGALVVIRHGFKCFGQLLHIAFFRPAHGLNPEADALYEANRLGVTRQLRYSPDHDYELDLTLSLNGVPVATAELKNPMTGTTFKHAIRQYREDRDPNEKIFQFKKRTLVHFAVDPEQVFMATKLSGSATYFLPFNRGYRKGAGNPPSTPESYATAYLWEQVWERHSWLDIVGRFIHLEVQEKRTDDGRKVKKETMIFPRYHQLDAVRKLISAARAEGPGHNYLIEHSAGSGKSNSIGWLAHRLASLHNEEEERVFDSVVVITDRQVLDRQLQDTIYQFEHKQGVVQKIDKDSKQLAAALEGGVPIIITTLQKFPFVTRRLVELAEEHEEQGGGILPTRNYAVIIDEAHSSQSGEGAADMKEVLGGEGLRERAVEAAREDGSDDWVEEEVLRAAAARGRQEHISFFAFTATPKHKTYGVFGRNREEFHLYSMKQAIEEGFIMDVLANYTTYKTYYRIAQTAAEDLNVPKRAAARALARFLRLHPHNIAQKTEVMVEHFRQHTMHRVGGKAKAMVVTESRLAAVRYKRQIDAYIAEKGYAGIRALVAFSGVVEDPDFPDVTFSEEGMNDGVKEKELPDEFATPAYQVLIVAEKYQTGFDQPLLHTMYVDKRLSGIQAVQTLSRLNRTHPHKEDTFVLDFRNEREEIFQSFKDYYEGGEMGEEPEPSRLYELQAEVQAAGLYTPEEVQEFCRIFFQAKRRNSPRDHEAMNGILAAPKNRFDEMLEDEEEEAELLRGKITAFNRLYAYLSQIIPFQDSDLEKLYTFLRFLLTKLTRRSNDTSVDLDEDVRLEYYRLRKISEGSIDLPAGEANPLAGPIETGTGMVRDEPVRLSELIDVLNERFGTDFTEADQLFFDQLEEAAVERTDLEQAANANPLDRFMLAFQSALQSLVIDRMEQNEEISARVVNDQEFREAAVGHIGPKVYERLRKSAEVQYGQSSKAN